MENIKWTKALSVGLDDIDEQHKELINLFNELYLCQINKAGRMEIGKCLDALHQYTEYHFNYEEEKFTKAGFPKEAAHKSTHKEFVTEVKAIIDDFKTSSNFDIDKVAHSVYHWLVDHIMVKDVLMAKYVKEHLK